MRQFKEDNDDLKYADKLSKRDRSKDVFIPENLFKKTVINKENIFKAARQTRKLTQVKLSKKCGIKQEYISQLENGKRNPNLNTIRKIAKALDCDYRIFLDD